MKPTLVNLGLGTRHLEFPLGPTLEWDVLEPDPGEGTGSSSVMAILEDVLSAPPAAGARVVIVVPDLTRPAPVRETLSRLVEALERRGVARERQALLVASGTHAAPASEALHQAWDIPRALALHVHDALTPGVALGSTRAGTPVEIDERYSRADWRITLGGVSFHYFAGFGGGPKMVFPGLASRDGTAANHKLTLAPWPPGGLARGCAPGVVSGNPVAEDIAEAAARAPAQASIHVVARSGGWEYYAGEEGGARAREVVRARGTVGEAGAYDAVVASAGGAPTDVDVVQAHKALVHAARYARAGAPVVLFAETAGGPGSKSFARWLEIEDPDELERRARSDYDLNAQTAISFRTLCERHPVTWVGSRCPRWIRMAGATAIDPGPEVERALAGVRGRGAVLPVATAVVPRDSLDLDRSTGRAAR